MSPSPSMIKSHYNYKKQILMGIDLNTAFSMPADAASTDLEGHYKKVAQVITQHLSKERNCRVIRKEHTRSEYIITAHETSWAGWGYLSMLQYKTLEGVSYKNIWKVETYPFAQDPSLNDFEFHNYNSWSTLVAYHEEKFPEGFQELDDRSFALNFGPTYIGYSDAGQYGYNLCFGRSNSE